MRNKLDGAGEVSLEVGHDKVEVITRESGGHGSGTTSGPSGPSGVGHNLLDLFAQTLKNIGATEFVLSPKEVVAGIPPFKEGGNLPKYIKSFELKL